MDGIKNSKVFVCSDANGNRDAMIAALQVICEENFGMLCIPACGVMTNVHICEVKGTIDLCFILK